MRKLALAVAASAALAVPSFAHAGLVAMRVQDVPLGARQLASVPAPAMRFNMLAAHWQGSGTVQYRVHRLHGSWSAWSLADADVSPDGGTGRWHDGDLNWTGASDRFQFRIAGAVRKLRAYELWARVTTAPKRQLSEAASPLIVSRAQWHANERIVRARPRIAKTLKLAIVHHTAGTNSYTRAQSAAIVRGIEVYHVEGNGWNDIGYNFLVDRFGTVYEGRAGGIERDVVGAHAEGFNTDTVGVSLIGNYSRVAPPKAQQDALVALLAWRLDVAHIDPLSTVVYASGGNPKYRAGRLVTLRAISGHRDTGFTDCPGTFAYRLLPAIAKRVAATGLPKIYSPVSYGVLGGPIHFRARLSAALPWTVTVANATGKVVGRGSGSGQLVDWTWTSPASGKGFFTWAIATPEALAATGTLGTGKPPPAPTLSLLAVTPAVATPAPDGTGAVVTASFKLGAPALVTAELVDAAGTRQTLLHEARPAGSNTFQWDAGPLGDGRYTLTLQAAAGALSASKSVPFVVDRTIYGLSATPPAFSPNGDGISDTTAIAFTLTQSVPLRVDVEQKGMVLATLVQATPAIGPQAITWDGTAGDGTTLPDGAYQIVVTVTDTLGDVPISIPVTIDTRAPTLTVVDPHTLTFSLDEPATVTITVNQGDKIVRAEPKGTFTIPYSGGVFQFSAVAQDAAGNVSAAVTG